MTYKDTFETAKELRTKENAYKAYDNSRAVLTSVSKLISAHGTVRDFQYWSYCSKQQSKLSPYTKSSIGHLWFRATALCD